MNIREATKIVSGNRKSAMPTTAAKMNIAQMMLPNVAMMLPGLGHLISETDKKQEEAEENIILHAHLKVCFYLFFHNFYEQYFLERTFGHKRQTGSKSDYRRNKRYEQRRRS
jgi:hypothetical protein